MQDLNQDLIKVQYETKVDANTKALGSRTETKSKT